MGYGIIKIEGTKISLLDVGAVKMSALKTHELKLKQVFDSMIELIDKHHPDHLAIKPFMKSVVQQRSCMDFWI